MSQSASPKHVNSKLIGNTTLSGNQFMQGLETALEWLEVNRNEINDLNVFPVPDGDTGSNMFLTLRSAVEAGRTAVASGTVETVLKAVAHGSLMGARGNSGVILSQIIRGFSQGLNGASVIGVSNLSTAFREAAIVAYRAVMKPTEGTMLTIISVIANTAEQHAHDTEIVPFFEALVTAAHKAVEKTPSQLPILREAGVVDAGGFGLAIILEGILRGIQDATEAVSHEDANTHHIDAPRVRIPPIQTRISVAGGESARRGAFAVAEREEGWGFCTEFLIHDFTNSFESIRDELADMGESALVVSDESVIRVHIHTFEPATVIAAAASYGILSNLKVDDMSKQHHEIVVGGEEANSATYIAPKGTNTAVASDDELHDTEVPLLELGVVAVAQGEGLSLLMKNLGAAVVVEGGQTMNPSTEDLLVAVRKAHAKQVVLLPNNKNIVLTAEQVKVVGKQEGLDVHIVKTTNVPQGMAALVAFDPSKDASEVVSRMSDSTRSVKSIEITHAVRDTKVSGKTIHEGDLIAIVDDTIHAVGKTSLALVQSVITTLKLTPELMTVYVGNGVRPDEVSTLVDGLKDTYPDGEIEQQEGGQLLYPYIISVE